MMNLLINPNLAVNGFDKFWPISNKEFSQLFPTILYVFALLFGQFCLEFCLDFYLDICYKKLLYKKKVQKRHVLYKILEKL